MRKKSTDGAIIFYVRRVLEVAGIAFFISLIFRRDSCFEAVGNALDTAVSSATYSFQTTQPQLRPQLRPQLHDWPSLNNFTVPKVRNDLGRTLEELGFKHGVEIGVQQGRFSDVFILSQWKSCQSYRLVDLWGYQLDTNYHDSANVEQGIQDSYYNRVQGRMKKYGNKTIMMRMSSVEAAKKIADASLDFAYVDARHDYCGVKEDIEAYWPKLRPGALMAGHDYVYAHEVNERDGNWSICQDGSVHPTAVRGAVDEFVEAHNLRLFTTQEGHATWMFRKPHA